jgi:hypothetical protein
VPTVGAPRRADGLHAEGPHTDADGGQGDRHDPEPGGEWLGLAEAAERLGCSVDTLRRRIKRQEVEARQVPTKHGPAWQLRLGPWGVQTGMRTVGRTVGTAAEGPQGADGRHAYPGHVDGGQEGGQPVQDESEVALAVGPALVQLVDRLQRENLFLAGQVGFLQAKLQTAEDTIRLLQAPGDDAPEDPPVPGPAGEPPADLEAAPAPTAAASGDLDEPPGWWRRVLAWLRG